MADIYIANSKEEGWKVWNATSNAWQNASIQDLLAATMILNESTGAYVPIDFKSAYSKGDCSVPIEWNAVRGMWQLKVDEVQAKKSTAESNRIKSLSQVELNVLDEDAVDELLHKIQKIVDGVNREEKKEELSLIDADAVEELLQEIKKIVNAAPDYKAEFRAFWKNLREGVFKDIKEESQAVATELTQALLESYQKLGDGVDEMLERVAEMENPSLDYKKELRMFRESLEETVKSALREELRPLVEEDLRRETTTLKNEEIRKESIKARLVEELTPIVRAELAYELRQNHAALEERPQLSKAEEEKILDETRARLIASVCLNGREIRDIKARLALEVKLSELDIEEQKRSLRSKIELGEKAALEQIRQQVLERDGYESLSEFRKSTVNDQKDVVIKELRRTIRPIVEGSLRKEMTLEVLNEISEGSNGLLSEAAIQVEYSLRERLADEVRKQELQNALFYVREALETMNLDDSTKLEIISKIEQETRMKIIAPKPKRVVSYQSNDDVMRQGINFRMLNEIESGIVRSADSSENADYDSEEEFEQI